MTVLDNLLVGMGHHGRTSIWQTIFNPVAIQGEEKVFFDKAMKLLDLLEIA